MIDLIVPPDGLGADIFETDEKYVQNVTDTRTCCTLSGLE